MKKKTNKKVDIKKEEILAARRERKALDKYGLNAYQTEPFSLLK
jgi:hypothetical protein